MNKELEILKTNNEIVEQKVVTDILNNDNTDYTPHYNFPTVKTDKEADRDRINENKNYIATELVKKERDIQTIEDITKKNQKDLIFSIVDPGDGIMTNEDITATDYTRNDNNEPVQPQLDPGVLNVMQEIVKIMAEQVAVMDNIPPALENIPQNEPVQIITQPDLQDIITKDEPDLNDLVKTKDEIADVISTPDIMNIPPVIRDIPNQADIISTPDLINILPNNLLPAPEDIGLVPPERTGIQEIDDKNYDKYLDTLQQIRSDLFISDDENSDNDLVEPVVEPKVEPKDEPDFTPFVDIDGNVLIKTETDEIPISDVYVDSDIESDTEVTPPVSDDENIPYIGDSDTEIITYTTPKFGKNRKDEIYRICAKKRALKTLAKKRAKKYKTLRKRIIRKHTFLYRLMFQ